MVSLQNKHQNGGDKPPSSEIDWLSEMCQYHVHIGDRIFWRLKIICKEGGGGNCFCLQGSDIRLWDREMGPTFHTSVDDSQADLFFLKTNTGTPCHLGY